MSNVFVLKQSHNYCDKELRSKMWLPSFNEDSNNCEWVPLMSLPYLLKDFEKSKFHRNAPYIQLHKNISTNGVYY